MSQPFPNQSIATRLKHLADDMEMLAVDMDYFGGLNTAQTQHARELLGASDTVRQWADALTPEVA